MWATCGPAGGRTFLSTLSLRRATGPAGGRTNSTPDFYPRSPCGERLPELDPLANKTPFISIHALLAESDYLTNYHFTGIFIFLSTLSLRRATRFPIFYLVLKIYFYPRSPCGERRRTKNGFLLTGKFLSTLSLRRATRYVSHMGSFAKISIHALLAESDNILCVVSVQIGGFLSTLSLRRATDSTQRTYQQDEFLSTLSLRRATKLSLAYVHIRRISIHALLAESD